MKNRKLLSGREVKEEKTDQIVIKSKCPEKWACIDLETGDCWIMDNGKHRILNTIEKKEVLKILKRRT